MKKRLAGVLVAMLVLAMGTTVFASQSPTSDAIAEQKAQQLRDSVTTIDTSDDSVGVKIEKVGAAEVADANQTATSYSKDAEVLGMVEVKSDQSFKKGVSLTFYVAGVKKGDNIRVLHKLASGKWEVIVPTVGDGYVRATFYSLSPIAIVKYPPSVSVPSSQEINDENKQPSSNGTAGGNDNSNSSVNSSSQSEGSSSSSNANVTINNYYPDNNAGNGSVSKPESSSSKKPASGNKTASSNRPTSGAGTRTSPKTGQEVPVLPIAAAFALVAVAAICGKKLV